MGFGAAQGGQSPVTISLDLLGTTHGSILYRGSSAWTALAPGTSGYVLTSNGAGADPSYQATAASSYPVAPSGGVYTTAAAGVLSVAAGDAASASGANSIALGNSAIASGADGVAVGQGASATVGVGNVAIGQGAGASGTVGAIAIGDGSLVAGSSAVALGKFTTASSTDSIAIGETASSTTGTGNIAIGSDASATGTLGAVAIGDGAASAGTAGVSVGRDTVGGITSITIGGGATTSAATDCVAVGNNATTASSTNAIAIGAAAQSATFSNIVAIGRLAVATAANQFVVGSATNPIQSYLLGQGVSSAAPATTTISSTGGTGAAVAGSALNLSGGISGDAATAGGAVNIQVAKASSGTTRTTVLTAVNDGGIALSNSSAAAVGAAGTSVLRTTAGGVLQVSNNGSAYTGIGQDYWFLVGKSGTQSINNVEHTTLTWDVETNDGSAIFTGNTFTVPVGGAGLWHFEAQVGWAANGTGVRQAEYRVNGALQTGHPQVAFDNAGATAGCSYPLTDDLDLADGDAVIVDVFHSAGAPLNVAATSGGTKWSGRRVGKKLA